MALRLANTPTVTSPRVVGINKIISGVQISFRGLTKVGVTSKFWLKLTVAKRHCREVGHLSTT